MDFMAGRRQSGSGQRGRRRLRLVPLILGCYGAFLGLGLVVIGLSELGKGVVGIARLVMGLGLAGFGLLGIWDGVRDVIHPERRAAPEPERQFILTDTDGNRTSRLTPEVLRAQLDVLAEGESSRWFAVQPLPPIPVEGQGRLMQVLCVRPGTLLLAAIFETPEGERRALQKSVEMEEALSWLQGLLTGAPDFSKWEQAERTAGQAGERRTVPADWYQRLHLYGESWHDEHKFFSARDVELAAEGIRQGKYVKALLELGPQAIELLPDAEDGLVAIWRTGNTPDGQVRFLAKRGTVTQVKFWLVNYLHGDPGSGWEDVTDQIQKQGRKWERHHG